MLRALAVKRSLQSLHHAGNHLNSTTTTVPPLLNRTRAFCNLSSPSPSASASNVRKYLGYTSLAVFCGAATYYSFPFPEDVKHKAAQLFRYSTPPPPPPHLPAEDLHSVSNWSGTHEVQTRAFHQPETLEDLESLVNQAHAAKQRIRPVGSGLSPNGIGFSKAGMVNLALMDNVLEVDKDNKRVRVQAGIRVQQLVDGIKDHGLTLQNFASIREQQIGGILQVGAHGTGATLPPIDEQIISMKLVTPAKGTVEISKEKDPELFYLARCGLGGLGVVSEVTIQCVEREQLVEHTTVSNMEDIKKNHQKLLSENKHVKYLYYPYSDTVVVVTCNPASKSNGLAEFKPKYTMDEALQHVRDLYRELVPDNTVDINELSFTQLREKLLALNPLNKDHVMKVNQAEAEFWKKSEGYRVGWADEILGFDCGGQQWVSETCFPAGTLSEPSMKDLEYIEELNQLIEKEEIAAPGPVEQRWTSSSKSSMSPASSSKEDDLFSWVGIIMYLPTANLQQRKEITERFLHYRHLTQERLWDKYSCYEHWAKIEVPEDKEDLASLQKRLRNRFPVDAFNKARRELDPNGIFSNNKLEKLFPSFDTT